MHKETATYYGVNGLALSDSKAFWGAIQEHCGVNDVCTRQSYDEFGRRVRRWAGAAKGSGWDTDANAQIYWTYTPYGSGQTANTVLEWQNPRAEGNFVRKVYNGLGELIQEQRPYQNWSASGGQEIIVDYLYDALSRQIRVGTPWLTAKYVGGNDIRRAATWNGYTETTYDAIDRIKFVTAPNGEQQQYGYAGRAASMIGLGRNGDPNKMLKWQESDGLGNLKYVRTYSLSGSTWVMDAQVALTHDVLGNLTSVSHPSSLGTTSLGYDVGGRKTSMSDPDLGSWSYAYDRQGKLTRQTDASGTTICLYYDALARLVGKHFRNDTACPASVGSYNVTYFYDGNHSSSNRSRGQLTYVGNGAIAQSRYYNAQGLLAQEETYLPGAPQTYYYTQYGYDSYLRPTTVTYPDNEVVTTGYNGMGQPSTLSSSVYGTLVDSVTYDEAGRLTQMRFPAGGYLYRTQTYWPWTGSVNNSNGRLKEIKVGTTSGGSDRLYFLYGYNSFGSIAGMTEQYNGGASSTYTFCYDAQNRLTRAYAPYNASQTCSTNPGGQSYSYDNVGRLTYYETIAFGTVVRAHMTLPSSYGYAFDNNGNLTYRPGNWSLTWNHENRLASSYRPTPYLYEEYAYDDDGQRVKKLSNGVATFYPNQYYEQTTAGLTNKYYYFNGQRVAQTNNGTLYMLHADHLGGMALSTSGATSSLGYRAYGRVRTYSGSIPTRYQFTGQYIDDTGLLYMNARYYDPEIGQFISPDSLVPDPANLFDYNRYMYSRANPMKFVDPTGHCSQTQPDVSDHEAYKEWATCSQMVNTILAQWDKTPEYWNGIYTSKEVFEKYVAWMPSNHSDLFVTNIMNSFQSDEYRAKHGEYTESPATGVDDLGCGTDTVCQAMVRRVLQVDAYCTRNDCVARGLDAVSTTSAAIAAGCAYGIVTAPCALPAGEISVAASALGTAWTTYQVLQGNGDVADLETAGVTLMIGINSSSKGVGLVASLFQTAWDFFRQHPSNNQ